MKKLLSLALFFSNIGPMEKPRSDDFNFKQCVTLATIALELDGIYRRTKEIIDCKNVEAAYLKALKCFIQTYEKNKAEGLIQVMKMWSLFLQIEHESLQNNHEYQPPAEIGELRKKVELLWAEQKKQQTPRITELKKIPEDFSAKMRPITNLTLLKLFKLRRSMEELVEKGSVIFSKEIKDDDALINKQALELQVGKYPDLDRGIQVLMQANKLLSLDPEDMILAHASRSPRPDTQKIILADHALYNRAHDMYLQALNLFIEAYTKNKTSVAFAQIYKTFDYMLNVEHVKRNMNELGYQIPEKYELLMEQLQVIHEQETMRRDKSKNSNSPQGSFISPRSEQANKAIDEAHRLVAQAHALQESFKSSDPTALKPVEALLLQATNLYFSAYSPRRQEILEWADTTLQKISRLNLRNEPTLSYEFSQEFSEACKQLRSLRAEHEKNSPRIKKN